MSWRCGAFLLTLFVLFRSEFLSKCHRIHGVPTAWSPKNCSKMVGLYAARNQAINPREFFLWLELLYSIGLVLASTSEVMLDSLPSYEMCGARGLSFMQFVGSGSAETKLRQFTL